jgi:thiamine phosphate synthase YjbQ (UPF0047 family)
MHTHEGTVRGRAGTSPGFEDITSAVRAVVRESYVRNGRVTVLRTDPGFALCVNEWESGLLQDLASAIERTNGTRSSVGSSTLVLPMVDGELRLGTWQRIVLVELERPCEREIVVQVLGE